MDELVQRVAQGLFMPQQPMSQAVFATIRAGVFASPFIRREIKTLQI